MAKITSLIKYQGSIDGVTIDRNGTVRMSPKSRAVTAERTKENNSEFAIAARQGKCIRQALSVLDVGDKYLSSRMVKTVRSGIALDDSNERGKRILSNSEAKAVLKGFELNGSINLQSVAPIKISSTTSETETAIALKNLLDADPTIGDLYCPQGCTHVMAVGLTSTINLNPEVLTVKEVRAVQSGKVSGSTPITLPTITYPPIAGEELLVVAIAFKFYQEVNGDHYQLQNGQHDVAKIIDLYFI